MLMAITPLSSSDTLPGSVSFTGSFSSSVLLTPASAHPLCASPQVASFTLVKVSKTTSVQPQVHNLLRHHGGFQNSSTSRNQGGTPLMPLPSPPPSQRQTQWPNPAHCIFTTSPFPYLHHLSSDSLISETRRKPICSFKATLKMQSL